MLSSFSDYGFYIGACYFLSLTTVLVFYIHAKIRMYQSNQKLSEND